MSTTPATADELLDRIQRLEADIDHMSRHDSQTGLLTRAAFLTELDSALNPANNRDKRGALVEVAISSIPRISGTHGRHVSDYVVSSLAARLNMMALPESLKARIDHSHFVVLLPNVKDPLEALTAAKEILGVLSQPVDWLNGALVVDLTAGVALAADNDGDGGNLIHNAELALRSATLRGGAGYAFFSPALAQSAKRRADVLLAVQRGLENDGLSLNFQPIFDAKSGELASFEALMRLSSPELGAVSPGEFIPVAEEAGLIKKLGAWALADACRVASHWPSHLTVAVNISPEQFYSGSLTTDVHNALELSSFPAYRLELEVTESTMLKDSESVQFQLSTLHDMGCSISLDDFGTGYSSLSYLWKFPFSKLKIDRSFINAMDSTPMARGILKSIIGLANNIGLKVTAEGIETAAQQDTITALGTHYLQGYLLGRPMAESQLASIVMRQLQKTVSPEPTFSPLFDTRDSGLKFG